MRDTRDPEQLGLAIKRWIQNGTSVLKAADLVTDPAYQLPERDRSEPPSQVLVSNHYRPSPNGYPAPGSPPQEAAHGH